MPGAALSALGVYAASSEHSLITKAEVCDIGGLNTSSGKKHTIMLLIRDCLQG